MTFRWRYPRRGVQLATLALIAAPLAGAGFFRGTLAAAELFGLRLADPLAFLQALAGGRVWVPSFAGSALLVCGAYLLFGGRSFCGWICPVGLLTELADSLRRRLGCQGKRLPLGASRFSLALVLGSALLTGTPLFEVLSPIGIVSRAVAFGALLPLLVPAALLLVEIVVAPRVWCRSLCPLGGFYSLMGRLSPLRVRFHRERCNDCGDCLEACPVPEVLAPALERRTAQVRAGDCSRCLDCLDSCSSRALSIGYRSKE